MNKKQIFIFLGLICFFSSQARDSSDEESSVDAAEHAEIATIKRDYPFALKTCMILDAAAIPNVGLEIYMGKRWSVAAKWHYAWWKNDSRSWYWYTYGGDVSLRRWFGKKAASRSFTGHHIDLYGQMLTYDLLTRARGYMSDKWTYGAGFAYGYSVPIAKRLNIDFALGVGSMVGEFHEYLPIGGEYVWQETKKRHRFGLNKAEISLVLLLGGG